LGEMDDGHPPRAERALQPVAVGDGLGEALVVGRKHVLNMRPDEPPTRRSNSSPWTRLITAGIMLRQVYRLVASDSSSQAPSSTKEQLVMKSQRIGTMAIVTALVSALGGSAMSAQD